MTKERGRSTAEAKDRENLLKKEEQRKSKTETFDEIARKNDSGKQRQRESTKERRIAEIKD